jgi:hypothetical protein
VKNRSLNTAKKKSSPRVLAFRGDYPGGGPKISTASVAMYRLAEDSIT